MKYFLLILAVAVYDVAGDCWQTGCQLDSWAVTGCEQYDRKEIVEKRESCPGGNKYYCCSNEVSPSDSSSSSGNGNSPNSSNATHNGDATWYDISVGYTACGTMHSDSEYIAATSFDWWTTGNPNNDPMCNKRARVTDPATGKSVEVAIKDKCQACKHGDIDLTRAAFQKLQHLDKGRFPIRWEFI